MRAGDNIHALRPVAAGTGSQLLLYEVGAARLVASFQVFDGVRVHGIEPRSGGPDSYTLAVFGERRVKLFSLGFGAEADGGEVGEARLELEQRLPGFDHWVLDARFLEVPRLLWSLERSFSLLPTLHGRYDSGAGRWAACDWSE